MTWFAKELIARHSCWRCHCSSHWPVSPQSFLKSRCFGSSTMSASLLLAHQCGSQERPSPALLSASPLLSPTVNLTSQEILWPGHFLSLNSSNKNTVGYFIFHCNKNMYQGFLRSLVEVLAVFLRSLMEKDENKLILF